MKTILLILTIAGAAGAQALTGLPGLALTGDPANPLLTNHSGKTLIAAVVVRHRSNNVDPIHLVFISPVGALPLKDGEEAPVLKGRSSRGRLAGCGKKGPAQGRAVTSFCRIEGAPVLK